MNTPLLCSGFIAPVLFSEADVKPSRAYSIPAICKMLLVSGFLPTIASYSELFGYCNDH